MSNWSGLSRSNYFQVKDEAAFREALKDVDVSVVQGTGGLAVISEDENGAWPSFTYNDETGDDEEIDLVALIAEHLADGQVAVMISAGSERQRYVSGYATAFTNNAPPVELNLSEIYNLAKNAFGVIPTLAEY